MYELSLDHGQITTWCIVFVDSKLTSSGWDLEFDRWKQRFEEVGTSLPQNVTPPRPRPQKPWPNVHMEPHEKKRKQAFTRWFSGILESFDVLTDQFWTCLIMFDLNFETCLRKRLLQIITGWFIDLQGDREDQGMARRHIYLSGCSNKETWWKDMKSTCSNGWNLIWFRLDVMLTFCLGSILSWKMLWFRVPKWFVFYQKSVEGKKNMEQVQSTYHGISQGPAKAICAVDQAVTGCSQSTDVPLRSGAGGRREPSGCRRLGHRQSSGGFLFRVLWWKLLARLGWPPWWVETPLFSTETAWTRHLFLCAESLRWIRHHLCRNEICLREETEAWLLQPNQNCATLEIHFSWKFIYKTLQNKHVPWSPVNFCDLWFG